MSRWTATHIPSQQGRTAVVTGTGGLGFETALALARAGGAVVIAGRDARKGADAVAAIHERAPGAAIRFEPLDLSSLESVAAFGDRLRRRQDSLDLLVNNAGVMVPPKRLETPDGFELQLGTNYLGHFALTGQLMPLLLKGAQARIVTVSSLAARDGRIDFGDLNAKRNYNPMKVYSQSKLACLMFAFELQRRSAAGNWGIASIAAHPGIARTDLLHNAPGRRSIVGMTRSLLWFLFQPAAQGALPTLFAATSPLASAGGYYGPDGMNEMRGYPAEAGTPPQALEERTAARLWAISEELTGLTFGAETERRSAQILPGE